MQDKIKTRQELKNKCNELKKEGKTIGFTSGVFDILHAGHVDYLEKAKQYCDILIVGMNTDESVRKNKGPNRPINTEKNRIKVIAALECVDHVFLFGEKNNNENIEVLKPHFYIKAGDYEISKLSSAPIVGSYGGEVKLIPVKHDISTTSIIRKVKQIPEYIELKEGKVRAVFLDRDGVINKEIEYLHEPEKFKILPGVIESLQKLKQTYKLIIITTQAGIGLGYFSKEDFYRVNKKMLRELSKHNIALERIYFCSHSKADNCDCRKPKIGLFKRAEKEANIDLKKSFMIGDKKSDIEAGKKAGCKTIQVLTGHQEKAEPDFIAKNMIEAANWIFNQKL